MEVKENRALRLSTLDNKPLKDLVNGSKLKPYKDRRKSLPTYFLEIQDQQDKAKEIRKKQYFVDIKEKS